MKEKGWWEGLGRQRVAPPLRDTLTDTGDTSIIESRESKPHLLGN